MLTTMQCLDCGDTRTTRQTIRWPDRRLKCAACQTITHHRAMVDPIQGDWREDLMLDPEGCRQAPGGERQAETPRTRAQAEAALRRAGVAVVFVSGLSRSAWLLAKQPLMEDGRRVVLINADITADDLQLIVQACFKMCDPRTSE